MRTFGTAPLLGVGVISRVRGAKCVGGLIGYVAANGYSILNGFFTGRVADEPIDPASGEIRSADIKGQTEQVSLNLKAVLEAAGSSLTQVVKTTCFLADMSDFGDFNEVYGRYFTGKPARSCVAVKDLPKGSLIEIEVIAEK